MFVDWLYAIEQWTNTWVSPNLEHVSGITVGLFFVAGVLTSLTPCTLSMLPITIGYLGGYGSPNRQQTIGQAGLFVLGFATTLTGLGLGAAFLGKIYGQTGWGWSVSMGTVAIVMGLQLLGVLTFPQWGTVTLEKYVPLELRAFGLGLSFGFASSPCTTPVLATLLTWVASTHNALLGGLVLLSYGLGSTLPLVMAGLFAGSLRSLLSLRQWSGGINIFSGVLLLVFGTYTVLGALYRS